MSNPPQSGVETCDDQAGHGAERKGTSPANEQIRHAGHATTPPAGELPRADIRRRAVGVVVLAYFALARTGWGMSAGVPVVVEVPVIVVAAVGCLGVGIHFFPLRRLFGVPLYDRTGVALCVLAVLTALLAPVTGIPALWTLIPEVGAALTLYGTAALLLRQPDVT
jgi:hypothetical protein